MISAETLRVLTTRKADVTGEGRMDVVTLYGKADNARRGFYEQLCLTVRRDRSGRTTVIELPDGVGYGYRPSLWTGDLTGDGVADMLVRAQTGGSGRYVTYAAYSCLAGEPRLLLTPAAMSGVVAEGRFIDGYKAIVMLTETGQTRVIDISSNKEYYDSLGIYKEGVLISPVEVSSPPFVVLKPIPVAKKGAANKRFGLAGLQPLIGVNASDIIGRVISTWTWLSKSGRGESWELLEARVIPPMNEQR